MAQTQSEKPPTPAQQTGPTSPERDPAESKNKQNAGSDSDPIAMLRADHRRVEQLFGSFEKGEQCRAEIAAGEADLHRIDHSYTDRRGDLLPRLPRQYGTTAA